MRRYVGGHSSIKIDNLWDGWILSYSKMPRFLRIQNNMIHVPSLFNVSMGTSCLGYPYMHLSYHTKQQMKISYGKWEECERDFNRVKSALKEVETALDGIILTEETPMVSSLSKVVVAADLTPVAPSSPSTENTSQ